MATVKTSALIADIRGAVGGNVFTRNKGGLSVRSRIKPLNPKSTYQQARRALLSGAAAYWAVLTAQVRADWQAYAVNTSWTNRLGDSINIGGEAAFIRVATMLQLAGQGLPAAAPTAYGHASATIGTVTAITTTQIATLAEPVVGWDKDIDSDWLLVFAAMPQPASREMAPSRWRFMEAIEGDSVTPETFPYALAAWPWTYKEGDRLTIAYVHIDPESRISVRTFASCFAAA